LFNNPKQSAEEYGKRGKVGSTVLGLDIPEKHQDYQP
jgi:hypothetical protein